MRLLRRWWFWFLVAPVLTVLAVQAYYLAQIWWWVDHNPETTSFMRRQRELLIKQNPDFKPRQKWVSYDRISENLKRAIIASEDANFSEHDGIDWNALEKAYQKNQKKGRVVAGGSTITQQLAKNLFLSEERSYIRKAQEVAITYMLEYLMDKERIFEIYLNVVEWGVGIYGAEAASQHYYGVPAANLSASQAAKLAVMLPNPRYYDQHRGTPYLMKRTSVILRRMGSAELP